MPNNVVLSNPGASLVRWGDGAATPYLTLSSVPTSGTVGVAVTGIVTNPGAATAQWTIATSPADTIVSPSSGTLSPGTAVAFTLTALAAGLKNVQLTSSTPDCVISGSPSPFTAASVAPPPPPPAPVASSLALSVASTGTTGSATLVTVTPNAAIGASGTATLSVSGGGTLGSTTLNFTAGSSAAQSTTLTRSTDGLSTVTLTNSMGLANTGTPATFLSSTPPAVTSAGGSANITLSSTAGTTLAPVAVGMAFAQGDFPATSGIAAQSLTNGQIDVQTTWPDGSAKFAIVSGLATVPAGGSLSCTLVRGSGASGGAISTTELQTVAGTVTIGAGAFGSASWTGSDWASPFRVICAGPTMSSWVYRKPIGSDAHLVGWLEVRLFVGGALEVLPWVENGYINVPSPTSKSETYTFTLGGTQRESIAMDIPARTRAVLVTGTKLAHWLGTEPDITVRHDASYLMSTGVVPYYSKVSADSVVSAWVDSITSPQEQGRFPSGMGSAGAHPSIGLLPQWDTLYLTNGSAKTWRVLQQQGYRAGRYGIHYRDESTNRVPRATDHSTRVFGGTSGMSDQGASTTSSGATAQTGTAPPAYKISHAPSMGYMAALVTGRWFHAETTQFAAAMQGFIQSDVYRTWASGVMAYRVRSYMQARGFGWAIRTLAQACVVTPDGDALRTELQSHLNQTVAYNHAQFVAQSHNPFGWMTDYTPDLSAAAVTPQLGQPFMQDFIMQALGYARQALDDGITESAKFAAWYEWAAASVIGRMGGTGATEWLYRDAEAAYQIAISPVTFPNWANGSGPWYSDWGAAWTATFETPNAEVGGKTIHANYTFPYTQSVPAKTLGDGSLREGAIGNDSSYWHNFQPALAYAVEHNITGAREAWARFVGAANFTSGVESFAASNPIWSVYPRAARTWSVGMATDTWVPLTGTTWSTWASANIPAGAYKGSNPLNAIVDAYCDPASDSGAEYFFGGGHGDGSCNAVVKFDHESLTYSIVGTATPPSKYPPSYVNGSALQPGPLTYPSGQSGSGFFLDGTVLTNPADTSYITPLARASTHMYGAAAKRGNVVHYFYLTYGEFNTVTGVWDGRGVSIGSQLATMFANYGSAEPDIGTQAVYDSVTDRFFFTLNPGDNSGAWRNGIAVFNPNTRTLQAVMEFGDRGSMYTGGNAMVKVGRKLYIFIKSATGDYTSPQTLNAGVIVDMDLAAAASGRVNTPTTAQVSKFVTSGDDIGSFLGSSTNQETIPCWYDGTAIRRWNYEATKKANIYTVGLTPASGSGTAASPYVLTQTARTLSGTPPASIAYVSKRFVWDQASGCALVLPISSSTWYAIKLS